MEIDRDYGDLTSLTIIRIPRIVVPKPQMQNLLRLPLRRPPLLPQTAHHLEIVRNKKADLPPFGPHALNSPGNSRQIPREPGIPLEVLEPVHPELAAGRLQVEVCDDALGVVLPAPRAVEPGAEGAEVLFEDVGGAGLRDQPADVHDCAEYGGFGGEVDADVCSFVVDFEGFGGSGLGEGHCCGGVVFTAVSVFFFGARGLVGGGAGNAGRIVE